MVGFEPTSHCLEDKNFIQVKLQNNINFFDKPNEPKYVSNQKPYICVNNNYNQMQNKKKKHV